jgi:hypothetical protein
MSVRPTDVMGDAHQVQHLVELVSVEDDGFGQDLTSGGADDVVLAHLGHPQVGPAMRLLLSRIWSNEPGLEGPGPA